MRGHHEGGTIMPRKKESKYYVRPDGLHETIRKINGKRVAFRGKTDAEVDRKMLAYRGEVNRGPLFTVVADDWWREHERTLSPNTYRGYVPAIERAKTYFKNEYIKEVKPTHITAMLREFSATKVSQKTVATQFQVIHMICRFAIEEGYIEYDPCSSVKVPKGLGKHPREAAAKEDEEIVKQYVDLWLLPYLILYTGLRKGEALALTYGDIDRDAEVIHVTKSVYYQGNKPYIKNPKTEAGTRVVPILFPLADKLPSGQADHYIFSVDGGKTPLSESRVRDEWEKFSRKTGLKATPHQLRHSFATMLFECDVSAKDAQDILGHAQLSTTMDIYTHIRDSRRRIVASEINKKLRGDKELKESTENTVKT